MYIILHGFLIIKNWSGSTEVDFEIIIKKNYTYHGSSISWASSNLLLKNKCIAIFESAKAVFKSILQGL